MTRKNAILSKPTDVTREEEAQSAKRYSISFIDNQRKFTGTIGIQVNAHVPGSTQGLPGEDAER